MQRQHALELTGQTFGRLTVLKRSAQLGRRGEVYWLCRCSCGVEREVRASSLRSGRAKSCGCYHRERVTLHGMTTTATFKSWESMLQRCLNPHAPDYQNYGGRGIKVCPPWIGSFDAFLADMGLRPEGASLDRIDVNGDYVPSNCRWATRSRQQRNKRTTPMLTWQGVTLSWADWAERTGIPSKVIGWRLSRDWPPQLALTTPIAKRSRKPKLKE